MIAFGFLTGILFPFFLLLLGLPVDEVLRPGFFFATITAGSLVGMINYGLAHWVIRPRIRTLAAGMRTIQRSIRTATLSLDWSNCDAESCHIVCESDDEIGESANAFNELVGELVRSHEMEQAASEFSRVLSSKLDLGDLARDGLQILLSHTGSTAGAVFTEAEGKLTVASNIGIRNCEQLINSDHLHRALQSGEILRLEIPETVQVDGMLTDFRPQDVLILPIMFKQQALGAVVIASVTHFTPETLWLSALFRQGFCLALNNALTHEHLQKIAALDPLTGCYNRRFGLTRLHEEFKRAVREKSPFGLLMFDIDHFKAVNDTYGHLTGDRVLIQIASLARQVLREGDIFTRYGGEEFIVLLPGASPSDTQEVAERIRRLIADSTIEDGQHALKITVSLGFTAFPSDDVQEDIELIKHADEALYTAKEQGRNQVRSWLTKITD